MGLVHSRTVRRARVEAALKCIPNPLVDICVQGEVASDGGADVGELADSNEFVVISIN